MGLCASVEKDDYEGINRYDGQKCLGFRHGEGTYIYENGDMYKGEWKWNKKHGHGVYTHMKGEVKEGYFYHDKYIGKNHEGLFAVTECSCFGRDSAAQPLLSDREEKSCKDPERIEVLRKRLEETPKKIEAGKRRREKLRRKYNLCEATKNM